LIIGAGLALIIAVGGLVWWFGATAGQRAEEAARSACAAKIRKVGGDPGVLRLAGRGVIDGATFVFWFDGATINSRAVTCESSGYREGGWISGVRLVHPDGTAVAPR
jgi:hypothetical protein